MPFNFALVSPVLAIVPSDVVSALLVAVAVGLGVSVLLGIGYRPPEEVPKSEQRRRALLRSRSRLYELFGDPIEWVASLPISKRSIVADEDLDRLLRLRQDEDVGWTPRQFRASVVVVTLAVGLGIFGIFSMIGHPFFGVFVACVLAPCVRVVFYTSLKSDVLARQAAIVRRLPFTLDLLALSLQAGGGIDQAAAAIVAEDPMPDSMTAELKWISDRLAAREPLREVMRRWKRRHNREEFDDLSLAIIQADQMGSPLGDRLRDQADRVLHKRWQNIEKASHEAQIKIILPAFLVLIACFLAVIVPFFVMVYNQYNETGGL